MMHIKPLFFQQSNGTPLKTLLLRPDNPILFFFVPQIFQHITQHLSGQTHGQPIEIEGFQRYPTLDLEAHAK
jgi:hypothetical protein